MKDVNKEKLTAYALGELSEKERAEIEKLIAENPELQAEIEEIQNFGLFLSEELKSEETIQIEDSRRGEFFEKVTSNQPRKNWLLQLIQGKVFPVGVVMTALLGLMTFFAVQQEMLKQEEIKVSGQMEALETSLAIKDQANKAQLIAPSPEVAEGQSVKRVKKIPMHGPNGKEKSSNNLSLGGKDNFAQPSDQAEVAELSLEEDLSTLDADAEFDSADSLAEESMDEFADTAAEPVPMSASPDVTSQVVAEPGASGRSRAFGKRTELKKESQVAASPRPKLMKKKAKNLAPSKLKGGGAIGSASQKIAANSGALQVVGQPMESRPTVFVGNSRGGEAYEKVIENPFTSVNSEPLSTFSVDVDTASYTNIRRYLAQYNQMPPADSIRIEEMINYFDYKDKAPTDGKPISVSLEMADSPWSSGHKLVRIGVKGKEVAKSKRNSNLVFLVDVSGSMDSPDKLGLLKEGLHKLIEELGENDFVSIVTYAGNAAVLLDSQSASNKKAIHKAVDGLTSGGGTHGSEGIKTAYDLAAKNMRAGGVNRVLLATDGDFNVGVTGDDALVDMVKEKAQSGVYLTVLGLGVGNLNDSMMEKISNKGNGNYFYIDSEKEARRVLVDKLQGTLVTIAKDVKVQVEFNPANVSEYRLIGYENRKLAAKDFNDDKKDAGEIGSGHSVVALYEIKPKGFSQEGVDPLKYQPKSEDKKAKKAPLSNELLTVKLRYKNPKESKSQLLVYPLAKKSQAFPKASADFRWTASVAGFGMLLKGSAHKGDLNYKKLIEMAEKARWKGKAYDSYRSEFMELVKKANKLSGQ